MPEDLVFEIGAEEIPAAFIRQALERLEAALAKGLKDARLGFGRIERLGTPRRLALIVHDLDERQSDAEIEARGPKKSAAYDASGSPTRALEGFARSQGVEPGEVEVAETDKGEYVFVRKSVRGEDASKILPGILSALLSADLFAKRMRWGAHETSFARPVHWILAVYRGSVVPLRWGHIESDGVTYGHRFMSAGAGGRPGAVKVADAASYADALREEHVIADPAERLELIRKGVDEAARALGGAALPDPGLEEEVAGLVEYPVVVAGSFDPEFLRLPRDVVVNAMREHQRYFSVVDRNGALMPHFIAIANTEARDMDVIRRGNERVLRARLGDAGFYFDHDREKGLAEMAAELKGVVFQARLGTSYEKAERFTTLALRIGEAAGYSSAAPAGEHPADYLCDRLRPGAERAQETGEKDHNRLVLGRAAMLSKADLVSGVVGEFPKLQGSMGGVYAEDAGEAAEVAMAIREHYLPSASGGAVPTTDAGAIISIADKLDTVCGCFGVGLAPTGAKDPYALRRAALGIIAVMLDKGFTVPLSEMIDMAIETTAGKFTRDRDEVRSDVIEFFRERLRNMLLDQGLSFDAVDAVLSRAWYVLPDALERVRAIEAFKGHADCARLVAAFKRVSNILKDVEPGSMKPDPARFIDAHEEQLYELSAETAPLMEGYRASGEYAKALEALASIKEAIDAFFDAVMVMVDETGVRENRLALLSSVRDLYYDIADISRLSV